MKKIYLKPTMEIHSMDVETICLNMSDKPAQKDKLVLGNERFIMEDMENEAAAAGEEDLW